jgi:hypothetical protein
MLAANDDGVRPRKMFFVGDGPRNHATYDTNDRERILSLFAWRSGAREEFEVKDDGEAFAASGGRPKDDP